MYVKNINFAIYINICKKISYYYKFIIFKYYRNKNTIIPIPSISSSCESEENIEPPLKKQKCFVFNLDIICVSRNLYNKTITKFLRKIKLDLTIDFIHFCGEWTYFFFFFFIENKMFLFTLKEIKILYIIFVIL